jgi:hypothetical protein
VARRYAEDAAEAAATCPSAQLADGLARLAHSMVDGLPAS